MYCKVEFLVKDEHVGRALRGLVGIAFDLTAVPVVNLKVDAAGNKSPETSGNLVDGFIAHLRREAPDRVDRSYARDWLASIGKSPASATHVIREARRHDVLGAPRGAGTTTWYQLTKRSSS